LEGKGMMIEVVVGSGPMYSLEICWWGEAEEAEEVGSQDQADVRRKIASSIFATLGVHRISVLEEEYDDE
jgi:hypothetical protein